jgi:hypothetical protein
MGEPATLAGYKVGTIIAALMGAGVTAGITPGPLYMRAIAGASGAATAFVFTPVFAPLAQKLVGICYSWVGVPVADVPAESIAGMTGFFLALVGIDACRWVIDATRKVFAKIPLKWPPTT